MGKLNRRLNKTLKLGKVGKILLLSVFFGVFVFISLPPSFFSDSTAYNTSSTGNEQFSKLSDKEIIDGLGNDANPDTVSVSDTSQITSEMSALDLFRERQRLQSIIDSNIDFVESDKSALQNFFDSMVELPDVNNTESVEPEPTTPDAPEPTTPDAPVILPVSERFVLETVVVKFDSDQVKSTESDIIELDPATQHEIIESFNFDQLSLVDSEGNLLDLGAVQVGFFGVVPVDNEIEFSGKARFLLDDKIVGEKHFGAFGQTKDKKLRAILSDTPTSAREPNFTFTFADEGIDWQSGEVHTFRVIITDIKAQTQNEKGDTRFFTWNGVYTAYRLEMTVDADKQVVIDDELDKAVSVFVNDGKIIMRNTADQISKRCGADPPVSLSVTIKDRNGLIVGSGSHSTLKKIDWERWDGTPMVDCRGFEVSTEPFIPRNQELRVSVVANGISDEFTYISPKTQHNVNVFCSNVSSLRCDSNIGWSYP